MGWERTKTVGDGWGHIATGGDRALEGPGSIGQALGDRGHEILSREVSVPMEVALDRPGPAPGFLQRLVEFIRLVPGRADRRCGADDFTAGLARREFPR